VVVTPALINSGLFVGFGPKLSKLAARTVLQDRTLSPTYNLQHKRGLSREITRTTGPSSHVVHGIEDFCLLILFKRGWDVDRPYAQRRSEYAVVEALGVRRSAIHPAMTFMRPSAIVSTRCAQLRTKSSS